MNIESYRNELCLNAAIGWDGDAIVNEVELGEKTCSGCHIRQREINKEFTSDDKNSNEIVPTAVPIGSSDDSWSSDTTGSSSCENDPPLLLSISSQLVIHGDQGLNKTVIPPNPRRSVDFSIVTIRQYALVLGDHPLCDMYPIALDWNYMALDPISVDTYELNHRRPVPEEVEPLPNLIRNQLIKSSTGSSRGIKAARRPVTERMSLLIDHMNMTSQQLYQQERRRQLLVQEEKTRTANASLAFL
jgi:hypothetical protein